MKKRAFTLVEIMAVVALIAILFVIFIPRIGFAVNKTKMTGVQTDFNSYRIAMQTTAMENNGFGGSEAVAKSGLNKVLDSELHFDADNKSARKDPWGNPYETSYANGWDEMVTISSKGIDGKEPLSISCIYKNGEIMFETEGPAIGGPFIPDDTTMFTYSDRTAKTINVVGALSQSDCTSPSGTYITKAKIGNRVTAIQDNAFWDCGSLRSIDIPSSVTTIGTSAFWGCKNLRAITIPSGVTTIGTETFKHCNSLKSVVIPNNVTTIGREAFYSCWSLASIDIPDKVTTIGESAFLGCGKLKSINVAPDNPNYKDVDGVLLSKDGKTLIQCPGGKSGDYIIPDGVETIKRYAFNGCTSLKSVTIPNGVKTIGDSAFYYCTSLTSANIPNSVTMIGSSAFRDCDSLTSIDVPSSAVSIGYYAFSYCDKLDSINIEPSNPNYKDIDGVLFNKNGKSLIQCPGGKSDAYTIPSGVETIEAYAFNACQSLKSVIIPYGVTTIENRAFWQCHSLTSITIPGSVKVIGGEAFSDCDSLTSVTIPNGVTAIRSEAFSHCDVLSSVTIPNSVTEIDDKAFISCDRLNSISVGSGNPNYKDIDGVLFSKDGKTLIKCPSMKSGVYIVPNSVTMITAGAFQSCTFLTSVTIPNSVTAIGTQAFYKVPHISYAGSATWEADNKWWGALDYRRA